ncbi:MAG: hypothetical protein LBS23_02560 [Holosporaceae bacterium]|jgi:hypothetical protein|nr:hypothetical protein [Holosporaceae bacterium]
MKKVNIDTIEKTAFQIGWMHVAQGKAARVRAKIMAVLDISTKQAFLNHLNGRVPHNEAEIQAIEAIFNEIGITEIWGKV